MFDYIKLRKASQEERDRFVEIATNWQSSSPSAKIYFRYNPSILCIAEFLANQEGISLYTDYDEEDTLYPVYIKRRYKTDTNYNDEGRCLINKKTTPFIWEILRQNKNNVIDVSYDELSKIAHDVLKEQGHLGVVEGSSGVATVEELIELGFNDADMFIEEYQDCSDYAENIHAVRKVTFLIDDS